MLVLLRPPRSNNNGKYSSTNRKAQEEQGAAGRQKNNSPALWILTTVLLPLLLLLVPQQYQGRFGPYTWIMLFENDASNTKEPELVPALVVKAGFRWGWVWCFLRSSWKKDTGTTKLWCFILPGDRKPSAVQSEPRGCTSLRGTVLRTFRSAQASMGTYVGQAGSYSAKAWSMLLSCLEQVSFCNTRCMDLYRERVPWMKNRPNSEHGTCRVVIFKQVILGRIKNHLECNLNIEKLIWSGLNILVTSQICIGKNTQKKTTIVLSESERQAPVPMSIVFFRFFF